MATVPSNFSENRTAAALAIPWRKIAWFGALLIACYAQLLGGLVHQWATGEDMSHGFFVPLVAAIITWRRRGEIETVTASPNYWGLALAMWGAVQMILGTLAAQLFLARTAFLIRSRARCSFSAERSFSKSYCFRWPCCRSCSRSRPSFMPASHCLYNCSRRASRKAF